MILCPAFLAKALLETDADSGGVPVVTDDAFGGISAVDTVDAYTSGGWRTAGYGQNDTYQHLRSFLTRRDTKKVDRNTHVIDRGDHVALRLHFTDVLEAYPDGKTVVSTGGWQTKTTRDRISKHLKSGWRIYQKDSQWYWYNQITGDGSMVSERMLPFSSGDHISADDTLFTQALPISPARVRAATRTRRLNKLGLS